MEPLTGDDPGEVAGYRLRARLGSGGMGRVYLAFTPGGRAVALKVVRPDLSDDRDFRRRFRQEVDAARRVHGLYTAQVLDADPDAVRPWLVTAYVPGPSLHEAVSQHGPMPELTVFVLLAGVAEALAAIHAAGVVHRDLKPSNVLLAPDGPRVIDFGIARAAEATSLTGTGRRIGSPQFMAPEQVEGGNVSPAVDVFALGLVGVYAACGRLPFGEGSDVAVLYRVLHGTADLTDCPERLRGLIERCLDKDPAARPAPAEVISLCQAQTAGQTGQIGQPWLPPAVAAALVDHVPPAAPTHPAPLTAPATQSPPVAPDALTVPPVPGAPVPAAGLPVTVTAGQAGPAAEARAMGQAPALPPTLAGTPGPHSESLASPGRARVSRTVVIAAVAVVIVAALVAAGVLILRGPSGRPRPRAGPGHQPGVTKGPASRQNGSAGRQSGGPSPSPTSLLDSCLVGTWNMVVVDQDNTFNGVFVQFSGAGERVTIRPDGSAVADWSPSETLRATVNGVPWTDVIEGQATMNAETQNGFLLLSDVTATGTWTLYDNGAYNNSGPLSLEPGPIRYTCSGNTLREYPDDGSLQATRVVGATGPGS
jgi:serine/threonine kinase PknH